MSKEERCSKILSQTYKTRPDYILLFIVLVLLSIGMLMVFSASPTMAMRYGDSFYYLKRHLFALVVGFIALYAGFKLDYNLYKDHIYYIAGISVFLLMIVLLPGVGAGIGGASRWIYFGVFSFQPAEIAKLALIMFLAKELSSKPIYQAITPSLSAAALCTVLILKQPDLGTSFVIVLTTLSILYFAGLPAKSIVIFIFTSFFGLLILSFSKAYRFRRLIAYVNPWSDPKGIGFHIIQSLIAVGSGGLFGLGLGGSKQKFFYLPQNYTDFIFAIFCEEMGLLGAIGVILLFFFFVSRGLRIVRSAPDAFSMVLSAGIVSWIGIQAFLNISVVLAVAPTTGIPLPFISYGGTALVVMLFGVGILLNISQYKTEEGQKRVAT